MKRAYRRPPCPAYDVEALESWLTDLAAEGLFLSEGGFFCGFGFFDRAAPRQVRYRLEAAPKPYGLLSDDDGSPEEADAALADAFGWQYVARLGDFYVYRTETPDAPELHTDPRVQALSVKLLRKRLRGSAFVCLFWAVLYPLAYLHFQLVRTMLVVGSIFVAVGIGLGVWSFVRALRQTLHLRRLQKRLLAGQALRHDKPWRRRAVRYQVAGLAQAALLAGWICVGLWLWSRSATDTWRVPLDGQDVPFATMADFAPKARCVREDIFSWTSNSLLRRSDPLAATVIEYCEHARLTLPDGDSFSGGLDVQYYDTRAPFLARQLLREIQLDARLRRGKYTTFPLPDLPVDEAVGYYDIGTHFPVVLLRRGSTVLWARFYQAGKDTIPLEVWVGALAESIA